MEIASGAVAAAWANNTVERGTRLVTSQARCTPRICDAEKGRGPRVASALLSLLLLLGLAPVRATAGPVDEASVHAAYVINFVRYSRWPPPASAEPSYVIAVLGSAKSVASLRTVASQAGMIRGKPVEVRALAVDAAAPAGEEAAVLLRAELGTPHAVYVAQSHKAWDLEVIDFAQGRPILTIGTGHDFVEKGGMLALVQDQGRTGFSANKQAIARAPLHVSARALMLARPRLPRVE